jgi:hypothetical protein
MVKPHAIEDRSWSFHCVQLFRCGCSLRLSFEGPRSGPGLGTAGVSRGAAPVIMPGPVAQLVRAHA